MYDWKKTLNKFLEAAGASIALAVVTALITGIESKESAAAMATGVALAVLRALQNYVKNRNNATTGPFDSAVTVLFVAGACVCFSGCLTAGAPSRGKIALEEETPTEHGTAKFSLVIDNKGEITENTSFDYIGETDGTGTPWELSLNGNREVRSPQALALAQGQAEALAKLPDLLAPLVSAFNSAPDGPAGDSIRDIIVQRIIETIMGRIGSGGLAGVLR